MLCCVSKALTAALGGWQVRGALMSSPEHKLRSERRNLIISPANSCAFSYTTLWSLMSTKAGSSVACAQMRVPEGGNTHPPMPRGSDLCQDTGPRLHLCQNLLDNSWVLLTWAGERFLNPSFNPSLFWSFVLIFLQLLFFQTNSHFCWVQRAKD